ncbi:GP63-like [Trichomonas vaginalis G3]|uniref:GP63-like n=1 Tax=Trichomonas vaginalis (strain ATCC PRA-98 / G3) TaxID=412133 RepID=A2EQK6_TRIV3|nr:regulation of choline O-acetyltransferase protein [Trichomonas vaginalis G3]EAY05053.1 GP63-like [Trichomonas vaginalis G3]KAI5488971.1 regulation of choline O-acetyltransferase protein [Trichomonas vaginalis G3]|eukprot:XP_001317276.1 GP63-like [Trichomonas vaginalis G3]
MLISLISFASSGNFKSISNQADYSLKRQSLEEDLSSISFQKIRIQTDYSFLTKENDGYTCRGTNQTIKWKYEQACQEHDIITEVKEEVIRGTFAHVLGFVEDLVKVRPVEDPFTLQNKFTSLNTKTSIYSTDLHITVVARPYPTTNQISTSVSLQKDKYLRPLQGIIYINPYYIPDQIQSDQTDKQEFFISLLHDMLHILGISVDSYKDYHPINSLTTHKTILCNLTVGGMKRTFLSTPFAHIFAKNMYGVDSFSGDDGSKCVSGIELENNVFYNDAELEYVSHRVYFTEIMTNSLFRNIGSVLRLTEVTLSILADSGFYEVNYRKGKPLLWGNPKSIDGVSIPDFALGSPLKTFPEGYLAKDGYSIYPSFDYKYYGTTLTEEAPKCPSETEEDYCKHKDFYNPMNETKIGHQVFDYMPLILPEKICPRGTAALNGSRQHCYPYKCTDYEKVEFILAGKDENSDKELVLECNKSNIYEKVTYNYYDQSYKSIISVSFICPYAARFCRSMELHDSNFETDPLVLKSKKTSISLGKIQKIIITISVIAIVMALAGVFVFWLIKKFKKDGSNAIFVAGHAELDEKQAAMLEDF